MFLRTVSINQGTYFLDVWFTFFCNGYIPEGNGDTADYQTQKINAALADAQTQLLILTNRVNIRLLLAQYNASGDTDTRRNMEQALAIILAQEPTFERIHLLNTRGVIVASTEPSYEGDNYSAQPVFQSSRQAPTTSILFKDRQGRLSQYLAAPLTLDNKFLGVVAVESRTDSYQYITGDYSQLGVTGESYLLRRLSNGTTQYLTPLRFKSNAALAAARTYDALNAILLTIKQGATTSETIKDTLHRESFEGASGPIKFDAHGDLVGATYNVFIVKNQQFVPLAQ